MKKAIYIVIVIVAGMLSFTSCKKNWHCSCTYNNTVMYTEDLQNDVKSKAEERCHENDSTITGQVWHCTIY